MDRGATSSDDPLAAVDALHRHHNLNHNQHGKAHDPPDPSHLTPHIAAAAEAASYKDLKQAWIADQTGSSVHLVNALALTVLATYAAWALLRAKRIRFVGALHRRRPNELSNVVLAHVFAAAARLSDWQLEFVILIVPVVAAHTVLASQLSLTIGALLVLLVVLERTGPPSARADRPAQNSARKQHWSKKYMDDDEDGRQDDDASAYREPAGPAGAAAPRRPSDALVAEAELPFRVSIDSAADAAHAAAAPPNFYDGPGSSSAALRSNADLSIDTSISTAPRSPLLGSAGSTFASRSPDSALLSPEMASISAFPSPTPRAADNANRTAPMQLLHSRDGSDAQSAVSASSAMSPLARSVVDPWSKSKPPSLDHSASAAHSDSTSSPGPTGSTASAPSDRSAFVQPQPFLTVYRAHMMLVTVISILAVDFPAFPRAMAKCESWGTSWMDMGVGSFVFSLGIVSALPMLKSARNRFRPWRQQLAADVRKSVPLVLLGSVRVIMVKGVAYPEHVSEYGVHWNFFFTLALLPFAATLSRPVARHARYSVIGLVLTVVHQVLLKTTDWQQWAVSDTVPRDTLVAQNKEGLTSMPGYLAIFYLGLDLGHYVLPLDPYFAYRKLRRRRARPRTDKLAMVLASLSIVWWMAYAAACAVGLGTSRRLANLPYVLWVVAFNTSSLLGYVLVYLFIVQPVEGTPGGGGDPVTPRILDDINRHSLVVFLVANLLTGVVNMATQTMYARDAVAVLILLVYTGACCAFARLLTARRFRLKL
jgi:phosphatidylinositol glycan class W